MSVGRPPNQLIYPPPPPALPVWEPPGVHAGSTWPSWSPSWRSLAPACHQDVPTSAPRSPSTAQSMAKIAPTWPNIAHYSTRMSQHGLQERPRDPKKPSKVLYCRRFFSFRQFGQDRPHHPKKSPRCSQKRAKLPILGSKLANLDTSWTHLGAKLANIAPSSPQLGPS